MQSYSPVSLMIPRTTPCVKGLIISNLVCWFVLVLVLQQYIFGAPVVYQFLGFVPSLAGEKFFIWQFVTYMFIHSAGVFHILFNMLVLWMFGSELEGLWNKKFFLTYYFVCGAGAAVVYLICIQLYGLFAGPAGAAAADVPMVGASGAVFGLLLAYGLIFGERLVLFMFIFPMKARTFTWLIACVELLTVLSAGPVGGGIANLAHLGGFVSGFLFLYFRKVMHGGLNSLTAGDILHKIKNKFKSKNIKIIR